MLQICALALADLYFMIFIDVCTRFMYNTLSIHTQLRILTALMNARQRIDPI